MSDFNVNYLGVGSATPTERHLPSCQVVDHRDTLMMVDCGEGAQLQFRRMHLKFSRLRHIFISHLHGDHFLGLPGLLSTMALHDTPGGVTIHTFREGIGVLRHVMDVFCRDTSFEITYHEIDACPGIVLDTKALTVETVPLVHRVPAVGFIFREKPKPRHLRGDMLKYLDVPVRDIPAIRDGADWTAPDGRVFENSRLTFDPTPSMAYGYCSDTAFSERVAARFAGVDTLYHEATYCDDRAAQAAPRGHSTAAQAGMAATIAGASRLVVGHYSKTYADDALFAAEARTTFAGEVIAAREGLKISLP